MNVYVEFQEHGLESIKAETNQFSLHEVIHVGGGRGNVRRSLRLAPTMPSDILTDRSRQERFRLPFLWIRERDVHDAAPGRQHQSR